MARRSVVRRSMARRPAPAPSWEERSVHGRCWRTVTRTERRSARPPQTRSCPAGPRRRFPGPVHRSHRHRRPSPPPRARAARQSRLQLSSPQPSASAAVLPAPRRTQPMARPTAPWAATSTARVAAQSARRPTELRSRRQDPRVAAPGVARSGATAAVRHRRARSPARTGVGPCRPRSAVRHRPGLPTAPMATAPGAGGTAAVPAGTPRPPPGGGPRRSGPRRNPGSRCDRAGLGARRGNERARPTRTARKNGRLRARRARSRSVPGPLPPPSLITRAAYRP